MRSEKAFLIVKNLNQFKLTDLIDLLKSFSNGELSLNFPVSGYQANWKPLEKIASQVSSSFIREQNNKFDEYETVTRFYRIDRDLIESIESISSDLSKWLWDMELPEDIILYRQDGLVLFESYQVDDCHFAVLTQDEIDSVNARQKVHRLSGVKFEDFGDLNRLMLKSPRVAAAIRSYSVI